MLLIAAIVVMVAALALTACGGGGSSSSGDDEAAIEEVIENAATTSDPSKCTEFQTAAFNEQNQGASGKEALEACEEGAEESETVAKSVGVSNVKVDGETATAEARMAGSSMNGQAVEIELAKEGGTWKLNKFLGFAHYDGKAMGEALEEKLGEEEGISASLVKCMGQGVAGLSQSEAESLAFEKELKPIEEMVGTCQ